MIGADARLDINAMQAAELSERTALSLAWNEHCNLSSSQSQRDEWARAFGRLAMDYMFTDLPN